MDSHPGAGAVDMCVFVSQFKAEFFNLPLF